MDQTSNTLTRDQTQRVKYLEAQERKTTRKTYKINDSVILNNENYEKQLKRQTKYLSAQRSLKKRRQF